MKHAHLQAALHFALIVVMMMALCAACSPRNTPEATVSPTAAEPTLTPIPTLPPFDETVLMFEEGKYIRDEYCGRIFNYTQTTYGPLTIAIADDLTASTALAAQVIERYRSLYDRSPLSLSQPITLYILPDPANGSCSSHGPVVFVDPEDLENTAFVEDMMGAATGISEYWVKAGLASLVLGEVSDNEKLKTWYQNTDDLNMAGLFYARFLDGWASDEEQQIARLSAASLLQYALEVEGIPMDRLAEQVDNEVRTRWLASLGVKRTVNYPYDSRFAGFTYSQSKECPLIVQADTMVFCLTRLSEQEYFDEISEAEFLINQSYYGRKALADYVMAEAPSVSKYMNPQELITMVVKKLDVALGYTNPYGNTIYIHNSAVYYYPLHEIVHTFDWNMIPSKARNAVWLTEGFAHYLGVLSPIYPQTEKHAIFEELNGRVLDASALSLQGSTYWYCLDPQQFAAAKAWYLAQGASLEIEEAIDVRAYMDAVSFATGYRDAHCGSRSITIGDKYGDLYPGRNLDEQDGLELSYTQAASMIAWLCDTYTLDRVLDVYINGAEDGLLDGKTYAELKASWQADLASKGQNIPIPDAP